LQQKLAQLGYTVTVDGSFGPGTTAAVVKFQTDKGITPASGVVDQQTWDALLGSSSTPSTTTTKP
jgi:peptidoglycan hydrolase-like protein with peptidoglycan-binding domain